MLQVYIAGTDSVSIIEVAKDRDGKNFFKLTNEVFVGQEKQPFTSDQTYVAKSADMLVIKQSSMRSLSLMPICSYKYRYSNNTFSCSACDVGLKSYGL